ncbi:hypothetical protein B0H16DRAFT_1694026 [Mycena metata]|uniref:YjeF N-terminal domain-containing protein n=1 Tax=Mycena metata TaxID=1033252 RepID=A0AAD7IEJ6_9AGAR|nr:hypothetical protein B0H16DRAFT_1694026 [Mycena metata]
MLRPVTQAVDIEAKSVPVPKWDPRKIRLYSACTLIVKNMKISTLSEDEQSLRTALKSSDIVLDDIFKFSFNFKALPVLSASGLPIVSVDIPSGWDVEAGNEAGVGLNPGVLVNLTAPKESVRLFRGQHFLRAGPSRGNYIPLSLFRLDLPDA